MRKSWYPAAPATGCQLSLISPPGRGVPIKPVGVSSGGSSPWYTWKALAVDMVPPVLPRWSVPSYKNERVSGASRPPSAGRRNSTCQDWASSAWAGTSDKESTGMGSLPSADSRHWICGVCPGATGSSRPNMAVICVCSSFLMGDSGKTFNRMTSGALVSISTERPSLICVPRLPNLSLPENTAQAVPEGVDSEMVKKPV